MGFAEWFEDTKAQVEEAFEKYKPVAEAAIIDWTKGKLEEKREEITPKANEAIRAATSGPSAPAGSLQAAFEGVLGQGVLNAHGGTIILGVGALVLVGFFLAKGAK